MATKQEKYIEAVGRRKTASARVRIIEGKQEQITVNDKPLLEYFAIEHVADVAREALKNAPTKFTVSARVFGGGVKAQAEAVRHGIARALVAYDQELRKDLKAAGFLKRDPRMKERKKFGLRKARRAPQWSKR